MANFNKQMEMVLYHSDEGDVSVDAYIAEESIWVSQKGMSEIFGVGIPAISKHLSNIFNDGELDKEVVISKMETTTRHGAIEGKTQQKGTVILSSRAPIGKVAIAGKEMYCNQGFKNLICSDKVLPEYLYWFLRGNTAYLNSLGRGATFKEISKGIVAEIEINLPDKKEQQLSVDTLKKVWDVIVVRRQELEQLDLLIKARFVEMFGSIYDNKFGYNVRTLQDVCEPIKDGTHQTPTYIDDSINGFKFLSSKDVTTGKIDWNHLKYIPEELHNKLYKRISPRKGDILLAKNGTTGVAAIVDKDEVFDIYVSLALIRPLDIVVSEYLCSAINSTETKKQFDGSLKGIGVPNLHLGEIKKTQIIVPPIELQNQFAAFVAQVDKSKFEGRMIIIGHR